MSVFPIGARVRKVSGSSWQGIVVGHYSTALTPDGVCVESEREPGSVQIYPARALETVPPETNEHGDTCGLTPGHTCDHAALNAAGHASLVWSR